MDFALAERETGQTMGALESLGRGGLAVLIGVLIASVGTFVWGALVTVNLQIGRGIAWSAVAMAAFLIVYWRWLGGAGWPARTASARARRLRAHRVDARRWRLALVAGVASAIALAGLWTLLSRASQFAPNALPDTSAMPLAFTAPLLLMGSLVAPLCEEAGYRGYLQGALEERYGPWIAIAVSALVFAAAHLTHGLVWEKQLIYALGGVVWGASAVLTRSILPGIVAHAITDVLFFTCVWPYDGARAPLAADTGAALAATAALMGAATAAVAFVRLAKVRD
jgi:membrane protease YdiL (CAAX protease family)